MSHIFISYSHKDSPYAHKLADALEQKGFEVWIDERIDYGSAWPRVIQEYLDSCSAFIVLMTPHAFESTWVQNELSRAMRKGKPIFPLLIEGDAWLSVESIQHMDVRDGSLPPPRFFQRVAVFAPPIAPLAESAGIREASPKIERAASSAPDILTITSPIYLELIRIPAGEFLMGVDPKKDKAAEPEVFQHPVFLPEFYIGKYPVTNTQYQAFVISARYRVPDHFENGSIPAGKDRHPVIDVSWGDAVAFCQWLAQKTGRPFRLPTEAEWEKAARGTDGRTYPWGNEWDPYRCNSAEGSVADTTPVGNYSPKGDSLYRVADMAGNVCEWCSSHYRDYPYDPSDGREDMEDAEFNIRVLRGGMFDDYPHSVTCDSRIGVSPTARSAPSIRRLIQLAGSDKKFGFRVAVSLSKSGL